MLSVQWENKRRALETKRALLFEEMQRNAEEAASATQEGTRRLTRATILSVILFILALVQLVLQVS